MSESEDVLASQRNPTPPALVLPRAIGDGLVLRCGTEADAEQLAVFNALMHRDRRVEAPNEAIAVWTSDLLTRPHPTFRPSDFLIIEERTSGAIVASLNLISQTWSYAGVPFATGRIELVGTRPDYRRRGLIRLLFEQVHAWSASRGELLQGITGIPWYYRQFGYEYALQIGPGRTRPLGVLPVVPSGADITGCSIRPATVEDVPFIVALDERTRTRYLVTCLRDQAQWRYEIDGRSPGCIPGNRIAIVERAGGRRIGMLACTRQTAGTLTVRTCELAPGESWWSIVPEVLRFLHEVALTPDDQPISLAPLTTLSFTLGLDHPLYDALPDCALPRHAGYAWYIRVSDLPAFLRHVTPVLERRLTASAMAGYTGELTLNFYRDGLLLRFAHGRLAAVDPWHGDQPEDGNAGFPPLTFLQLLLGHRSLDELEYAFPDCDARTEPARALLNALFPKQASYLWPIA